MRIVVLAGGLSTERDVSISSGLLVASALREKGHQVVLLDVFTGYEKDILDVDELFEQNYSFTDGIKVGETISDIDEIKENRRDKSDRYLGENVVDICSFADITFLALHGGEGENGQIQAAFDLLGIRYTGSGYLGSALAMNKGLTKSVLIQNKVLTPRGEIFNSPEEAMKWNIFPCVVKPCSGGSSVGITIVHTPSDYAQSVKDAFCYGETEIVVEQYVVGREFSVGLLGGRALPPIEIIPEGGFYDYRTKYQAGAAKEVCPADITEAEDKAMRDAAVATYDALHLSSYARVDFILDKFGNPYCLEANTLPGMTPTSLMPQEALAEGMSYADLCEKIIEISLERYAKKTDNSIGE
ncbi:MAG: D-alanine--D-alanine ligase [Ruminococcus sp.]|nr:D-alanine--D-alanine ligase [Ruminococcus sp.]